MKQLLTGLTAALPIASGYIPVAITFGLIVQSGGLSILDAALSSVLIFAGAAQFLAAGMFFTGAGVVQIVVSAWLLNLRHLLMSSVVANNLVRSTPRWQRNILAFGITDEVFGITSRFALNGKAIDPAFLIGLEVGAYLSWVGGTIAGASIGNVLPPRVQQAMGMALYALFAVLLAGIVRDAAAGSQRRRMIGAALLGGGLNWIFRTGLGLSPGVAFPIAMIVAAVAFTIGPNEAASQEERV